MTGRGRPFRSLRRAAGGAVLLLGVLLLLVAAGRLGRYLDRATWVTFPPDSAGRPLLYLLYQPGDCETYRGLVDRWDDLHREGIVAVRALELGAAGGASGGGGPTAPPAVSFPARRDDGEGETAMLRLGFRHTPLSVLVDGDGRPRLALPAPPRRAGRAAAETLVRRYAAELLERGDGR